jgi:NitT/TauT family transport system substrate-binding protein
MGMQLMRKLAAVLAALLIAGSANAQAPERKDVKLGVGGANSLYYLPLALADKLGYFKEQGLNVEINDFKGGSQSLNALVSGSADVVTGAYEHTLRMQVKGQSIVAVIELGRYPGISLAVKKDRADKFKTPADLKGAKIGVTAPGSSTNMLVQFLMVKAGLKPDDASFIGVGAGPSAVAAMRKGEIDAISNIDPMIAMLEAAGDVVMMAETRTTDGTAKVLGGPMSAGVLYTRKDFIDKNPNTVQALVNAFYKTLAWLDKATPEHVADAVPKEFWLGDKTLYMAAVKASLQIYSRDGIVSTDSQQRSIAFLKQFDKEIAAATIDPAKTWDDRFVKKAAATAK